MCRSWWPALTNQCCSTVRDDSRVCFHNLVVLVTLLATASRAHRTSVSKDAPQRSARPAFSTAGWDAIPASARTAQLPNLHRNVRNPAGAERLADSSAIGTPRCAAQFDRILSRPLPATRYHKRQSNSGAGGIESLASTLHRRPWGPGSGLGSQINQFVWTARGESLQLPFVHADCRRFLRKGQPRCSFVI